MTEQTAKNILMGAVAATPDEIQQAHDFVYGPKGTYNQALAAQQATYPPTAPPYGPPAMLPIFSDVGSTDPNVFMSADYGKMVSWNGYAIALNNENAAAWNVYRTAYLNYRTRFINTNDTTEQPPTPPAYMIGISFADFQTWYAQTRGINAGATYTWAKAQLVSTFDFASALETKKAGLYQQAQHEPAMGQLLQQPTVQQAAEQPMERPQELLQVS